MLHSFLPKAGCIRTGERHLQRGREQPELGPSPVWEAREVREGMDRVGRRWDTQTFPGGGEVGKRSAQPDARAGTFAEAKPKGFERELGL